MGKVDGCGYDSQQKDAICDACGLYRMIQSTLKTVFCGFQMIGYTYELFRCLDVEIYIYGDFHGYNDR